MKLMNVKGTSDSLPNKEIIKRRVVNILTDTFEKYGYLPLDSSILCYYDLLASKYAGGSEILKEVYTLNDQGDRELGLRYDLTVPFAKVISMNVNKNISLPLRDMKLVRYLEMALLKVVELENFISAMLMYVVLKVLILRLKCLK